jgi:endonuclease VIII
MPEGDVVWFTAQRLHEALAGRALTRSDFRVPRLATADLTGDVVIETASRGKHLLTRTRSGLTVHTHLRMDGSWRIRSAAEQVKDSHRIRLILANDDWQAVGYQLGVVELIRTRDEVKVIGHLGPDLLGPDWDCAEAVRRLSAEPARAIGEALLDQRNLAGIGNLYKAEVLFLRGVNPWQPTGSVTDLGAMAELARRLLDANKDRIGQVTTGSSRRGEEAWVYGRRGRPCRRCGTPIRSEGQQDRVTFWCPSCQPRIGQLALLRCRAGRLGGLVVEVDDAEPVTVGVGQDDEVGIVRIAVPVDPAGAERYQAVRLRRLLVYPGRMQVEVQARVILGRRPAGLQRDHGAGTSRRRGQDPGPSAEGSLVRLVPERRAPELLGPAAVGNAQHHHAEREHRHSLPGLAGSSSCEPGRLVLFRAWPARPWTGANPWVRD